MEGSNQEAKGSKLIARGSKYKGSGHLLRKRKEEIIICDFLKVSFTEPSSGPGAELSPVQPLHLPFTLMLWIRCHCLHLVEGEVEAQWDGSQAALIRLSVLQELGLAREVCALLVALSQVECLHTVPQLSGLAGCFRDIMRKGL